MVEGAYTLEQLCEVLNVTKPTALNLIRSGKLRAVKISPDKKWSKWLISKQSVQEFLGDKPSIADLVAGENNG